MSAITRQPAKWSCITFESNLFFSFLWEVLPQLPICPICPKETGVKIQTNLFLHTRQQWVASSTVLLFCFLFFWPFGLIDRASEVVTRDRMRDKGSDTQQRAPVQNSNPDPLQQGQSLCTWDAHSTAVMLLLLVSVWLHKNFACGWTNEWIQFFYSCFITLTCHSWLMAPRKGVGRKKRCHPEQKVLIYAVM